MADIKISQLPSATTPLTGLEEVPLVQSGTTKKATVIDLVTAATVTTDVLVLVRNTTGSPLSKGTVVYINGATGQTPTVAKALASTDATSAQTLGMVYADISNNATGYVVNVGLITNIDTSAFTDGTQLYLSGVTAGGVTSTKPYAPLHLVYVGIVEYAHPVNGKIFVSVQNGYEMDELHNVSAQTPSNGQTLVYNSSTQLWTSAQVGLTNGVTGVLPVANGGNGTATPSLVAGSNVTITGAWPNHTISAAGGAGTVTSIGGTGTVNGITLTGTVTSSGNLTLGGTLSGVNLTSQVTGALPVANGGTGATTLTGLVKGSGTSAFTAATAGTDYVAPATATTFTAKQTFSGSASTLAASFASASEVVTVSATAATGTINYDVTTQSVLFYTSNASANWTVNFRASSGTSLNTALAVGESVTVAFLVTQGSTAYFNSSVQVDGTTSGVTTRWQGGAAPTAGYPSGVDAYVYTIIKTGGATFSVFASQTRFA